MLLLPNYAQNFHKTDNNRQQSVPIISTSYCMCCNISEHSDEDKSSCAPKEQLAQLEVDMEGTSYSDSFSNHMWSA